MASRSRPTAPRRSVRNLKKQTMLQFSPLPSSSPAKEKYSPAIQDRLASVRYQGARQSPREADTVAGEVGMLPTPEPSSQIRGRNDRYSEGQEDAQDSLISSPTPVRSVNVIEEDDSDEDGLIPSASKRRRLSPLKPSTNLTSSPPPRRSARFQPETSSQLREVPIAPQSSPTRRESGRLRRRSTRPSVLSPSHSSQSVISVEVPTPPPPTSAISDLGSAETSDEDDRILASMPTSRRRKSKAVADDPFVVSDDHVRYVSDEDVPSFRTTKPWRKTEDDFVVDDENVEYISSEEDARAPANRRNVRKPSRSHKPPRTSYRQAEQEQEELEEDLQDLQDSEHEESSRKTRTRGGPVTTQRDKAREHFDLLKRRRAGEKVPRVVDSDDEEEEEESEGVDIGFIGRPHEEIGSDHSSVDTDQESVVEQVEDEDDFIIQEDSTTGRFGRPHPDMPLQFTSFASSNPRDLFPHIIEWLVKNKIAPAFSRDDEVFTLAFDRLEDQVKAQAGSRLISSAWGSDFKRAILARPGMKVVALPGMDEDNMRTCDACNRTNHPARYEFVFSGEPYYKKTLEPVDHSDDEDEEDSHDDGPSYDEDGHILPSVHRRYYLGRFCAANAEMGHKLTHWKYHLNESLMAYLEEQGVLSADAIVARDKMNKKKREKEAENIVDSMEEIGVIGEMWKDFENDLNDARLGMEDFEKKGGRSKGRVGAIRSTGNGLVREWNGDRYRVTKAAESDSEGD
ncbi:hypothetical protein PV11_03297 [Exophiala sideris]|uniref:DUF4211 domain-containing protein n=1 Tax=Exophiala sideris TaxID=1016849 RepID=A0A0D1WG74_9EURO|nr:hypothetical protein PV11_03297 [Exophiala sideris]